MNTTDPIADLLTRIRNAKKARHPVVTIPASKVKIAIIHLLKKEGFESYVQSHTTILFKTFLQFGGFIIL